MMPHYESSSNSSAKIMDVINLFGNYKMKERDEFNIKDTMGENFRALYKPCSMGKKYPEPLKN